MFSRRAPQPGPCVTKAFEVKAAVSELRRRVRHQFRLGGIEHGNALAFDFGEEPGFPMPDDAGGPELRSDL